MIGGVSDEVGGVRGGVEAGKVPVVEVFEGWEKEDQIGSGSSLTGSQRLKEGSRGEDGIGMDTKQEKRSRPGC